jgi:hypothetical protein
MELDVDHVPFAWERLDPVRRAAAAVGLPTTYGGPHSDGGTEMALVPLADGAYLELVAATGDGEPRYWPAHVAASAGPADWCLRVDDAGAHLKRAIDAGVPVRGPRPGGRERPDGRRLEWDVGHLDAPGLPFVVADRTPRAWRVAGDDRLDARLAEVVVAVEAVATTVDRLTRLYGLPTPVEAESRAFDATLHRFPGTPVTLAAPDAGSRLAERVANLGAGPCAFLLSASADDGADDPVAGLSCTDPVEWVGGATVRWLDAAPFAGRLGVRVGGEGEA